MELYRYRTIESAIRDIETGAFHFASPSELNDPMEGYVSVYWKGDRAAWEGLFRNYICSYFNAIENYLLAQDEKVLWEKTLMIDINAFDKFPIGKAYREIGNAILADQDVIRIISVYGDNEFKCFSNELHLILQFIHIKAFKICITYCHKYKLIPEDMVNSLIKGPEMTDLSSFPFEHLNKLESDEVRRTIAMVADHEMNDLMEFQMICSGMQEPGFTYGRDITDFCNDVKKGRQHRNWMALVVDFPKMYIHQLKNMIYPESYYVCFSGKNDDSAMWGNYADHHRGVCLVYDADYNRDRAEQYGYYQENKNICPKKVEYGGKIIERNFFETFGRLTIPQIKGWLTGKNGVLSNCFAIFDSAEKIAEWREKYWEVFNAKNFHKLEAWKYEDEYRILIDNSFGEYVKIETDADAKKGRRSRNLKYDKKLLKGVIFGIMTSEYDKARIVEVLEDNGIAGNITYYQAEYDDVNQKIIVRKKGLWCRAAHNN